MTIKLTLLAFLLLLLCAHAAGDTDQLLGQPLSMFRDGEQAWLGYALFAALLVLSLLHTLALARTGHEPEATVSGLAAVLLLVVAATPSLNGFHEFCSLQLLLLLYVYYAAVLHHAQQRPLLYVHLAVPALLASATGFHSYGVWQKGIIVYFAVLATARHHLLFLSPVRRVSPAAHTRPRGASLPTRRRKVYRVEAGRAWARRQPIGSST